MAVEVTRSEATASPVRGLFARRTVLCDGAMGTMLYARGIFINRCFDELNLSQPEMVRAIHEEYLQAGAEVIETNTFGANAYRLEHFGLRAKVREINAAGVRLARESVAQIRDKQSASAFVAGALGPVGVRVGPGGEVSGEEAEEAFRGTDPGAGGGRVGCGCGPADRGDAAIVGGGGGGGTGSKEGGTGASADRDGDRGCGGQLP